MDTTELELELLDLEALYERTRNTVTKSELEGKIALKKNQIKEAKTEKLNKNVIPTRDTASRMDHTDTKIRQRITIDENNTFNINI